MPREFTTDDHDTTITAQAIIELTEANVSVSGNGDEWQREVAFLHDSAEVGPPAQSDDLDEMIEFATALA